MASHIRSRELLSDGYHQEVKMRVDGRTVTVIWPLVILRFRSPDEFQTFMDQHLDLIDRDLLKALGEMLLEIKALL